jgi:FtsZ-interacting cell division protein YlmF
MGGFFRKTLSFFGLADEEEIEVGENEKMNIRSMKNLSMQKSGNFEETAHKKPHIRRKVSLISSRDAKKSRVFVAEPEEYEEIKVIADNFKNEIPVIINLQKVDQELSKRIIDFCSGLTYALEGDIKKVADRVFLITPSSIEVSSKESDFLKEDGFLNTF